MLTASKLKVSGCELCDGEGCVACDPQAMALAMGFTLEPVEVEEIDAEEEELTNAQEYDEPECSVKIVSRFRTKKGRVVESPYTNAEAMVILKRVMSEFARKLIQDHAKFNRLYPDQWAWVHILALEQVAKENGHSIKQAAGWLKGKVCGKKLHALMMVTFDALKHGTRFTFVTEQGKIELTMSKSEKNYKRIWISNKTKEEGSNILYGSINADGQLWYAPQTPFWVQTVVNEICLNPQAALKKYGLQSGNCCICRLTLTDSISLRCGYGPVCAKKYGLPYA